MGLQHYNGQGTKRNVNVSCVALRHKNQAQLDVYFIDGNLRNTVTSNLKTVCANCQRLQGVRRLGWRVGDLVADD